MAGTLKRWIMAPGFIAVVAGFGGGALWSSQMHPPARSEASIGWTVYAKHQAMLEHYETGHSGHSPLPVDEHDVSGTP